MNFLGYSITADKKSQYKKSVKNLIWIKKYDKIGIINEKAR